MPVDNKGIIYEFVTAGYIKRKPDQTFTHFMHSFNL